MRRKWAALLVVFGFVVGLGMCLTIAHDDSHHHGSEAPSTLLHTGQACKTSVVPCERQSTPQSQPLIVFVGTEQNSLYEDVSLRPPFPPPRV